MVWSIFRASFYGLGVPIFGFWIAGRWLKVGSAELIDSDHYVGSAVAFCEESAGNLTDVGVVWCEQVGAFDLIRPGSVLCGGLFVCLIGYYIFQSIKCGTDRDKIAAIFPRIVPLTMVVVAGLLVVQTVMLSYIIKNAGIWPDIWPFNSFLDEQGVGFMMIAMASLGALMILYRLRYFIIPLSADIIAKPLNRKKHPEIWKLVGEIASTLGAKKPDNIVVGLEPNFFAASIDITAHPDEKEIKGETLYLSLPLMRLFTRSELTAVIGHELGHFRGEDTTYTMKFAPVLAGLKESVDALSGDNGLESLALKPAEATLSAMLAIFESNTGRISQIREFEADKAGVEVSSSKALATSLAKLSVYASVWEKIQEANVERLNSGKLVSNLSETYEDSAKYDISNYSIEKIIKTVLETEITHPTDSHPSLKERYDKIGYDIGGLSIVELVKIDEPSSKLIGESLTAVEKELTAAEHRNMTDQGLVTPPDEEDAERVSDILNAFYILAASMIAADGKIKKSEMIIAEKIGTELEGTFDVLEFREICRNIADYPSYADNIAILAKAFNKEERRSIYRYLTRIAKADREISKEEGALLTMARDKFGLGS